MATIIPNTKKKAVLRGIRVSGWGSGPDTESRTAPSVFISARALVVETIEAMQAAFIRPHLDSVLG